MLNELGSVVDHSIIVFVFIQAKSFLLTEQ